MDVEVVETPEVAETDTEIALVEPQAETEAVSGTGEADLGSPSAVVATPAPAVEIEEPEAPVAPTVLLADEDGIRVLQNSGDQPEAMSNVSIDAITYD